MSSKIETDVLILIEHKARELETAVLLKYFLEKNGLKVIIDSIKFHKESIVLKYKPEIAIVPWAYSNKEVDLFRNFNRFGNNTIIVNMHHEQISNDGSDAFIVPREDAKKTMHVSWGNNYTQKLLDVNCKSDSIIQCGNPRLDFYKHSLRKLSKSKEELSKMYNLDNSKKWILFIANSFHLLSENQININLAKGVDIEEQISVSIDNRNAFLKYANEYLEENDDSIFIYRPHPSYAHLDKETPEITELCKINKNFRCISENSIRDWIINSDICMSFHSTSVIECAVANTPFYLFRITELSSEKDYRFFNNYKYKIEDRKGFINSIKAIDNFSFADFNVSIREYIDLNINTYASESIVDELVKILSLQNLNKESIQFKMGPYIKALSFSWLKKLLYSLCKISILKKIMLNTNDIRFFNLYYEGDDYLTKSDIKNIEDKLNKILTSEMVENK